MSKYNTTHTATSGWNNRFNKSGQPNLSGVINKGKAEEIKADESGLIRAGYRTNSDEKEIQDVSDEIKRYLMRENNGDLGTEIANEEVFKYAVNNVIDAEDLELPPPEGCGMKPVYVDENAPTNDEKFLMQRWQNQVMQLDKRISKRHDEYRKDMRNMIAKIMEYFCSLSIRLAIEKTPDFVAAQGEESDMTSFLEALDFGVRKIITPGLSDDQIRNKEREDTKQLLVTLRVADYQNSLLYVQKIQKVLAKHKRILIKERVAKLSALLTLGQKAAREREIENETQETVDRDATTIRHIYKEYYDHAMLPEYRQQHDRLTTEKKCGTETPYKREVVGGLVTGGLDNMLKEFTLIANASMHALGQAVYIVIEPTFKRALNIDNGQDKRLKLDIDINNQEVIVPCDYCLTRLEFERGAATHDWTSCMFNEDCRHYVGDDRKLERESRADKYNAQR